MTPARQALDWVLSVVEAPAADELTRRFTARFLAAVPVAQLADLLPTLVAGVRDDISSMLVQDHDPCRLTARIGTREVLLAVDPATPDLIDALLFRPAVVEVNDPRLADPPVRGAGPLADLARSAFVEGRLVGLSLHTDDRGTADSAAVGWADLASRRALDADVVFPAYSITKLLTTVAVLQLDLDLDAPVASLLHELRVPADVTVRHLLTHHGGLSNAFPHWGDEVPALIDLLGREVAADRAPGEAYAYSNAGFAVLGQVVAGVTGRSYEDVVTERVLSPLGMTSSTFPRTVPPGGVTLHDIADEVVVPADPKICTVPPAGGLWSTAADLTAFARDWATLLPAEVAAMAISRQARRGDSSWIGFGWLLGEIEGARAIGHAGGGVGASTSLLALPDEGITAVALTNRSTSIEPIAAQALQLARQRREAASR